LTTNPDRSGVLRTLVQNSYKAIDEGYYNAEMYNFGSHSAISLLDRIVATTQIPIICEIKFSSPSHGKILDSNHLDLVNLAGKLAESGIVGLSVITQPYLFRGSIHYLAKVRRAIAVPILMKDLIVSEIQIDAAKRVGADCILLIKTIFDDGLAEGTIDRFVKYAENKGLNVLIEVHKGSEYKEVIHNGNKRHLIGINNRNLDNLTVDLNVTKALIRNYGKGNKIVISESGIHNADQIRDLSSLGVDGYLIGTSIMESEDPVSKVRELCESRLGG
jgi:indole-3-glycerol phosphate synthase